MSCREKPPLNITVIGATGSVGSSVLDICRRFPGHFRVHALGAFRSAEALAGLCREFSPSLAGLGDPSRGPALEGLLKDGPTSLIREEDPLGVLAEDPETDLLVFASSGTDAIPALRRALELGKTVSVANKESLIVGGPWIMPLVEDLERLRPLDSEHNALWQCLKGEDPEDVRRLVVTASGGPFRSSSPEQLRAVRPGDALRHPVWNMGRKITIDSATLMNKGLEVLEASRLFRIPLGNIDAWIHPTSRIHGVVHFQDGCSKYLASCPDMRIAGAVALGWPRRLPLAAEDAFFRTEEIPGPLEFFPPDGERFPCLPLAYEAGRRGGAFPALLVGADEAAVEAFLEERIGFMDIPRVIEGVLEAYGGGAPASLEEAIRLVSLGREEGRALCRNLRS